MPKGSLDHVAGEAAAHGSTAIVVVLGAAHHHERLVAPISFGQVVAVGQLILDHIVCRPGSPPQLLRHANLLLEQAQLDRILNDYQREHEHIGGQQYAAHNESDQQVRVVSTL